MHNCFFKCKKRLVMDEKTIERLGFNAECHCQCTDCFGSKIICMEDVIQCLDIKKEIVLTSVEAVLLTNDDSCLIKDKRVINFKTIININSLIISIMFYLRLLNFINFLNNILLLRFFLIFLITFGNPNKFIIQLWLRLVSFLLIHNGLL